MKNGKIPSTKRTRSKMTNQGGRVAFKLQHLGVSMNRGAAKR